MGFLECWVCFCWKSTPKSKGKPTNRNRKVKRTAQKNNWKGFTVCVHFRVFQWAYGSVCVCSCKGGSSSFFMAHTHINNQRISSANPKGKKERMGAIPSGMLSVAEPQRWCRLHCQRMSRFKCFDFIFHSACHTHTQLVLPWSTHTLADNNCQVSEW